MISNKYSFGYPTQCNSCQSIDSSICLTVEPHFKKGSSFKVMLIGQDPTIFKDPQRNRVKEVLMLNEENGQLKRWLKNIFGKDNFDKVELYATTFSEKASIIIGDLLNSMKIFIISLFSLCYIHL